MICPHSSCKKNFTQPLELFNGIWFCPHCKKSIFPDENTSLVVTEENYLKLVESDKIFYSKWLANREGKDRREKIEDLKNAINLCMESAYLKNPYALVNMGFYFENNYVESHKNIFARMRVAYLYYNAVCYNKKDIKISMSKNSKPTSLDVEEVNNIKKQAAINLYNLLDSIPKGQEKNVLGINKTLKFEKEKIVKLLKELGVSKLHSKTEEVDSEDKVSHEVIFDLVVNASKSAKSFLFGIFQISKSNIDNLIDKTFSTRLGKKKGLGDLIEEGKIKMKIAEVLEVKGRISEREAREFDNIDSKNVLLNLKDKLTEGLYFVFLFNNMVDNEYLPKTGAQRIYKIMTNDNDNNIRKYIQDGLFNSYIFTSEDIYKFSGKLPNYQKSIEALHSYCLEE
ncbi:MAG: hypothetical protein ACOX24_05535 [Christensenellales bacterium]|jgi:hypothetical protein